jgi:hypothetical protein
MLLSIVAFEDNDIQWNEDDPSDNTGAIRISHLPWSKIAFCSNEDVWIKRISSVDELLINKEDLPTLTLSESVKSIIKQLFTNEDI